MRAVVVFVCLLASVVHATPIDAPVVVQAKAPNGSTVQLHDVQGPCVAGAKLATWVSPGGETKVQGCFKVSDTGIVQVAWFDTDTSALPARVFRRLDES